MPWPGAKLQAKKLKNYDACWTNTKGAGDDHSYELAFPEPDAFPGLGPAALSVARHGCGGAGCGPDDAVPPSLRPLRGGRRRAGADARSARGNVLLSRSFRRCSCSRNDLSSGENAANGHRQHRGSTFIQISTPLALA